MTARIHLVACVLLASTGAMTRGADRHVPADYATIQAAIDASVDNDVVIVADGTWTGAGNKNLDFGGRAITVRSANGAAACIIDCEEDGRGFVFQSGETNAAIVDGFTIRNGHVAASGGAISCTSSSPTLRNCILSGNDAGAHGGGLFCVTCDPVVSNCTVSGNTAGNHGGGIHCTASNLRLTGSTVRGNTASEQGGGLYCAINSDATLTDCTLDENNANLGAGVYCTGSDPTFTDCVISGNTADMFGGIYATDSSPTLVNCVLDDNDGGGWAGGIACQTSGSATLVNCTISNNTSIDGAGVHLSEGAGATITNCLFYGNEASSFGGGCSVVAAATTTFTNCTIVQNTAGTDGGGVVVAECSATMINCILWGNTPNQIYLEAGSVDVTFSDVQGDWAGVGNLDTDPLFADAANDDYRLTSGSPCSDAGANDGVPADAFDLDDDGDVSEPVPLDLAGNTRFADDPAVADTGAGAAPVVDMGAYEACASDADGDGTLDCMDGCPEDPDKTAAGTCGCGTPDVDTDGDGTLDCLDGCPEDPNKTEAGVCGCGVAEGTCGSDAADGDDGTSGDGEVPAGDGPSATPRAGCCPSTATLALTLTSLCLMRTWPGRWPKRR